MTTLVYQTASAINSAMSRVYGHMAMAILTSMIVSWFVGSSPDLMTFFFTGWMKWLVIFAPLVAVFGINFALHSNPSKGVAVALLHGFAALMGLSFATIFTVFKFGSIVSAFMGGATLFILMSGYGYFTKQSLDSLGKYLLIGLIAIVIASIINVFVGSSFAQMIISAIAIIVFLGLTAYDTQKIREQIMEEGLTPGTEISGALSLYLDFINLFLSLLQLFGDKKE